MGRGPVIDGKRRPITPWEGSWAATVNRTPIPPRRPADVPAIFRTDLPVVGVVCKIGEDRNNPPKGAHDIDIKERG